MQRNLSTFRGEGERIVDNMMEVMQEMKERQPPERSQAASSQRSDRHVNAVEDITTRGRWAPVPPAIGDVPPRPPPPARANSDTRPPRAEAKAGRRDSIAETTRRIHSALEPEVRRNQRSPERPNRR
eukprot:11217127-Karenia_brevis.AAC.1